jgi:hypothetical protein
VELVGGRDELRIGLSENLDFLFNGFRKLYELLRCHLGDINIDWLPALVSAHI